MVVIDGSAERTAGAGAEEAIRSIAAEVGGTVTPLCSDTVPNGDVPLGADADVDEGEATVTEGVAGAAGTPGAAGNPGLGSLTAGESTWPATVAGPNAVGRCDETSTRRFFGSAGSSASCDGFLRLPHISRML